MNTQRGFTLLEMIAAIALLAIASTVLLGGFGQSARSLRQAEQSDRLDTAARSIMDSLDTGALATGSTKGTWDALTWALDVGIAQSEPGRYQVFQLDLTVADGSRQARYSTLRTRAAGTMK
jgi:general secretion pathway protein I